MQTANHEFYGNARAHTAEPMRESSHRAAGDGYKHTPDAGQQNRGVAGRMMNVIAVAIDATLGRYDR
jgi:hypothetical protein